MIHTEPFQLGRSNLVHILLMTRGGHIDFQGQGSKVKVTCYTLLLNLVNTIQTEPFQLGPSNLVHILLMTRGRHLLIFKVKGQGHTLHIIVKPCKHDTDLTVSANPSNLVHINFLWQEDNTYWFSRSWVKGQGHKLNIVVKHRKQDKPLLYCQL